MGQRCLGMAGDEGDDLFKATEQRFGVRLRFERRRVRSTLAAEIGA